MQLDFLVWLQSIRNDLLNYLLLTFTFLGLEYFYLVAISIMYWSFDRRAGFRIGMIFILSMFINDSIKNYLRIPRPSGSGLLPLYQWTGGGYAFPSGHAQGTATFWGALAYISRKKSILWAAVLMIFLVSLSRLYFALHYPVDVVGGILIGFLAVGVFMTPVAKWEDILKSSSGIKLWALSFLPLLLLVIHHEPTGMKTVGALCGFALGHTITESRGGLRHTSGMGKQIFKVLLGILFLAVLYVAPKYLMPDYQWVNVFRYWLITWAATFVVPEMFVVLGLARREV